MSEGGLPSGSIAPRLRIKGRAASVMRFFWISVAFMVLWILVTSQLGHYSKLFGPQILLQLNLAFYLPSIPVLLLSGSLERALDVRMGPIGSIALRINAGLGGCLLLAGLFPLLPGLRPGDGPLWPLLTVVAILGGLSAVAFSSSYQLVQFFRAADTIGLGVGCVGAGPLVLLVQLALEVGPSPERWQWIAMYEIAAGLILVGLLSSLSLCGQYWKLLNESASRGAAAAAAAAGDTAAGAAIAMDGNDGRVPLLAAAAPVTYADEAVPVATSPDGGSLGGADGRVSGGGGSPTSPYGLKPYGTGGLRVRVRPRFSLRPTTAPDPSNVFNLLSPGPNNGFPGGLDDEDDSAPPLLLRRSASAGAERGMAAQRRRMALAAAGWDRLERSHGASTRSAATLASQYATARSGGIRPNTPPPSPEVPLGAAAAAATATPAAGMCTGTPPAPPLTAATLTSTRGQSALSGMASAPPTVSARGQRMQWGMAAEATATAANGGDGAGAPDIEFGVPDMEPVVQPPSFTTVSIGDAVVTTVAATDGGGAVAVGEGTSGGGGGSSFATAAASVSLARALQGPPAKAGGGGAGNDVSSDGPAGVGVAVVDGMGRRSEAAYGKCDVSAGYAAAPMTVQQEVVEVVRGAWQVMLGFLVSVTVLYIVFPFFTYVKPSGWMGDSLPQVLFYARLFTDLAGRLLPRRRSLQLRSGGAVLALSGASTAAAALFFMYILAPASWGRRAPGLLQNDLVPTLLVVFLWLAGGYTNTISNMLAPAMVFPELAGRATAVMALLFNVAHIGGLVIAAAMAAAIFGDVVG